MPTMEWSEAGDSLQKLKENFSEIANAPQTFYSLLELTKSGHQGIPKEELSLLQQLFLKYPNQLLAARLGVSKTDQEIFKHHKTEIKSPKNTIVIFISTPRGLGRILISPNANPEIFNHLTSDAQTNKTRAIPKLKTLLKATKINTSNQINKQHAEWAKNWKPPNQYIYRPEGADLIDQIRAAELSHLDNETSGSFSEIDKH